MTDFGKTWYVGSGGHKLILPTWSVITECPYLIPHLHNYLFWLANNKRVKYPEFYMGYIDETWYVGSDGHK